MRGYVLYKLNTYTLIGGGREGGGERGRRREGGGERGRRREGGGDSHVYCIHVPLNFFKLHIHVHYNLTCLNPYSENIKELI